MITWEDTFGIIKKMFNINQNEIANLLKVSKYTISKIKNGNLTPAFSNEDIYRKIFDPNTPESPAKDTERYSMSSLKDIIKNEFYNVKEAMKDYWVEDDKYKEGDYKAFVMRMLERTIYSSSSKDKEEANVPDIKDAESQTKSSTEQMLQIFKQTYQECYMYNFFNAELFPGIDPQLLMWAERFIKTIKHDILEYFENQKAEPRYINISRYNEALHEYKCYLEENTRLWLRGDRLIPKNDECKVSVEYYRKRLSSLFQEIHFG